MTYQQFLTQFDECGECGNAACRGVELFPMRVNGKTVARCWECLDLVETTKAEARLDLMWGDHPRDGGKHTEWHASCGCAYHPNPFPHVHPCGDNHKRPDLHAN